MGLNISISALIHIKCTLYSVLYSATKFYYFFPSDFFLKLFSLFSLLFFTNQKEFCKLLTFLKVRLYGTVLCQIKTSMIHCRVKLKLSKTSLIHLWVKLSALWDSAESNWALPRTSLNKTVRDKLSIVQGSDETSFRVQTKRCSGQCWINQISFSCTTLFTRTVQ